MSLFLMRQHVKRKRKLFKRFIERTEKFLLSATIVLLFVSAIFMLYWGVVKSPYFSVKDMIVTGDFKKLNGDLIKALSGVKNGDPLFLLNVADIKKNLFSNPWVKFAAVRRNLPDAIWIYVEEYEPAAILAGDKLNYVDSKGYAFKELDKEDERGYAILSGVDTPFGVIKSLELMGEFLSGDFGKKFGVSEITYDDRKGYAIVTDRDSVIVVLGKAGVDETVRKLNGFFPHVSKDDRRLKYIIALSPDKMVAGYKRI